jgi:FkbM family methyltransferase
VQFKAEHSQDLTYHEFRSEESVIENIISELDEDDVFYDIGANIGLYSCVLSKKLNPGNVIAFEPSPPAYRKLQYNSRLNESQIIHYQIAVSDENSRVEFAVDVGDVQSRKSTLNVINNSAGYKSIKVDAKKLATIVQEEDIPLPSIIKIDVEGAEHKVLHGMGDLLSSVKIVYCEVHSPAASDFDATKDEIIQHFSSAGFTTQCIDQRGDNAFLKATQ